MTAPRSGLVLGRVTGHRGGSGELTVRVASGDAARWTGLRRVVLVAAGVESEREIESARAYRDRLVLKLEGVDDANAAEGLRGNVVKTLPDDVPELPEGRYWLDDLVGREVVDRNAGRLGRVVDVIETGGGEVLVVAPADGEDDDEILIPLVRQFVLGVDGDTGEIRTDAPSDLLALNRES